MKETTWHTVVMVAFVFRSISGEDGHVHTELNAARTQELTVCDWQVGSNQHALYSTMLIS